jgi:molybdenum cofactor synthesis domain-containing protein
MEKRAINQPVNPVLPTVGFVPETLLAPQQAIVAFFARARLRPPGTEMVALDDAVGRVLAQSVVAGDDYPNAARSLMDGFALQSQFAPGDFEIVAGVVMGAATTIALTPATAMPIPTGGLLPPGADAVVPIEDVRVEGSRLRVEASLEVGSNVAQCGADMRRGETILKPGRRIRGGEAGVLATLGVTNVLVYRRPAFAVLSSGDELVEPQMQPRPGEIRDSNRYAVAASLQAMGAVARHYPTLRDEADAFESGLACALAQCDGVVVTGGSSVGERDRLPHAVAQIAKPGAIVHGLRVKPGKPTLLGADGGKPILGLPGNPTSALFMLEAVASPIVAALTGAPVEPATVQARLENPAASRAGWTWYVPVSLRRDGGMPLAQPLALRSFSVSLAARADGYIVMDERDEAWAAGTLVTVHRFLGG